MKASLDVVHARQIDDPFNRGNPASIGDCDTDKINQLVFDQLVAIPDRIEDFANFCYVNDMENVLTRIREVRAARNTLVDGTAVFLRFIYPVLDAFQNGSREESKLLKLIDDLAEVFYRESGLGSPV